MSLIDLHVHTTASDGAYTPEEVAEMAAELGVRFLGIADHDSTDGIAAAQRASGGTCVTVVPAVEINAAYSRSELHVLGYHVDPESGALREMLGALRESRASRALKMVERLRAMGMMLDWDRVVELAGEGSVVGRPHIALALVERGYASTVREAFTEHIARGRPGYIGRHKLDPVHAIELIVQAGGLPVLAHPLKLLDVAPQLVPAGLAGLEAYYTGYSEAETALIVSTASKHGLFVTGGSDFHGGGVAPEARLGGVDMPLSVADLLAEAHQLRSGLSLP